MPTIYVIMMSNNGVSYCIIYVYYVHVYLYSIYSNETMVEYILPYWTRSFNMGYWIYCLRK